MRLLSAVPHTPPSAYSTPCTQANLPSSFNILKLGAPLLAEAGGGSIVCVSAAVVHHGAGACVAFTIEFLVRISACCLSANFPTFPCPCQKWARSSTPPSCTNLRAAPTRRWWPSKRHALWSTAAENRSTCPLDRFSSANTPPFPSTRAPAMHTPRHEASRGVRLRQGGR
jgi:hypothetical protein